MKHSTKISEIIIQTVASETSLSVFEIFNRVSREAHLVDFAPEEATAIIGEIRRLQASPPSFIDALCNTLRATGERGCDRGK